jgi:polysaccharide deacetylase 2 family uncharacterized protein YibQ
VAPDDLNAPLGQGEKKSKWPKLPLGAPQVLAGLLGLCGLVVVGWALFVTDPLGGEPVAVVATPAIGVGSSAGAGHDAQHSHHDGPDAKAVVKLPPAGGGNSTNGNTVTIIDGSSGHREEVVIPNRSSAPHAPAKKSEPGAAVDKRLLEMTPQGALPKIGPDGVHAYTRYAQAHGIGGGARIGVVVGGVGIGAAATATAFAKLPPAVTFALAPYGNGLQQLADRARAQGHEVLLQVPMEPFDYPDNDPGPRTLLTSLTADQNIERLHWLMSRFQGYVGLISYMGTKFATSEPALTPVMREAAKRGLLYVDDGTAQRSVAAQLAGGNGVPFAKAAIVLDAVPTPVEINRALARLELAAHDHGAAVGFASAQPAAIAAIAAWAKTVASRGFVLVPITAIAVKTKSS